MGIWHRIEAIFMKLDSFDFSSHIKRSDLDIPGKRKPGLQEKPSHGISLADSNALKSHALTVRIFVTTAVRPIHNPSGIS